MNIFTQFAGRVKRESLDQAPLVVIDIVGRTSAEYMRQADLCIQAAKRCSNLQMALIWQRHFSALITKALRVKRGWQ